MENLSIETLIKKYPDFFKEFREEEKYALQSIERKLEYETPSLEELIKASRILNKITTAHSIWFVLIDAILDETLEITIASTYSKEIKGSLFEDCFNYSEFLFDNGLEHPSLTKSIYYQSINNCFNEIEYLTVEIMKENPKFSRAMDYIDQIEEKLYDGAFKYFETILYKIESKEIHSEKELFTMLENFLTMYINTICSFQIQMVGVQNSKDIVVVHENRLPFFEFQRCFETTMNQYGNIFDEDTKAVKELSYIYESSRYYAIYEELEERNYIQKCKKM